jgi:hypothetical protein
MEIEKGGKGEKLLAAGNNDWNWVFTNNRPKISKIKPTMCQKLKI